MDDSYILDSASTISFNSSAFNSPGPSTRAGSPDASLSDSVESLALDQAASERVEEDIGSQELTLPSAESLQPRPMDATSRSMLSAQPSSASPIDAQDPFLPHPLPRPTPRRVSPPLTRPCTPSNDSPAPNSPHIISFPSSPLPHPRRKRASTDGSSSVGTSEEHEGGSSAAEEEEEDHRGLGLRMPSMTIARARMASAGAHPTARAGTTTQGESTSPIRILIFGKTSQDRSTLARLLLEADRPAASPPARRDEHIDEPPSMSASFFSTTSGARFSDRSRSRSSSARDLSAEAGEGSRGVEEERDGLWEVLGGRNGVSLVEPPSVGGDPTDETLRRALSTPLEKLESMLNSCYPSSSGLLQLVMDGGGDGGPEACLMLMSSPPTPDEVSLARSISHLLPFYPVLILPPSPSSSKKLKTTALLQAVSTQIFKAGVRWLSAPSSSSTSTSTGTIHLLPHELFTAPLSSPHHPHRRNASEESGPPSSAIPSSLSSSQELLPPSPTFTSTSSACSSSSSANLSSSRSHSPRPPTTSAPDLDRLRSLLGLLSDVERTTAARQRLRREKAVCFLEWREIEIAARGASSRRGDGGRWEVTDLPSEWEERPLEQKERGEGTTRRQEQLEKELEFSRRVAERRKELRGCRPRRAVAEERPFDEAEQGDDEASNLSDTLSVPLTRPPPQLGSSLFSDVATPRCPPSSSFHQRFPFPLAPLAPSTGSLSSSAHSAHSGFFTATSDPLPAFPSSSLASSSSSLVLTQSAAAVDPFHLPSLLQLVGLNIRMSLLPTVNEVEMDVGDEKEGSRRGSRGRSWIGTAAVLSVVFLAGALVGVSVVSVSEGLGGRLGAGWWRAGLGFSLSGGRLVR